MMKNNDNFTLLSEVAGEGGSDWAPQKFLSQNMLSSWDTAVCLYFWEKFKMAARGPKRVPGQDFWCFLLPNFF